MFLKWIPWKYLLQRAARAYGTIDPVTRLVSDTGQWPEAVHPNTGGGCMGDGQHGWAAAEWVMMVRNLFEREERDRLILGSGILPKWLDSASEMAFGPTLTPFGPVRVRISGAPAARSLHVDAQWRDRTPLLEIRVPGCRPLVAPPLDQPVTLQRDAP
jgi:hypothetical protein